MEVIFFEPETGTEFTLEIGYFDTALEIKHRIQEYRSIPVSRQTLTFNGLILLDDNGVTDRFICENSRISLTIAPDQINLLLNLPTSSNMLYSALQIDVNASIDQLKKKILLMDLGTSNLSIDQIVLQSNGWDLSLGVTRLGDYGIRDETIIDVTVINSSPRSSLQNPHMTLEEIFSAPPLPQSDQILHDITEYEILQDFPIIISQETLEKSSPPTQSDQINFLTKIPTNNKHDVKTLCDYDVIDGAKNDVRILGGSGSAMVINSSPRGSSRKPHDCVILPDSDQIKLLINLPAENTQQSCLKMNVNDKIGQLKEKVLAMDIGISRLLIKRITLHCGTKVLSDDEKTLRDYHVKDRSKIDVLIKASPRGDLKIVVVCKNNKTGRMEMRVNAMDNVGKLREALLKRNHPLPNGDYFFAYDRMVMNDDKSWWWHQVCKAATIEIFQGKGSGRL